MMNKKREKEFSAAEKSHPLYINPWGVMGGLFLSVINVLLLTTAFTMGIDKTDVIIISILILMSGVLHSLTIKTANKDNVLNDLTMEGIGISSAAMRMMRADIRRTKAEVAKLKKEASNRDG